MVNCGQTLHSGTTPHTSPSRASYGVSFVRSSKKNGRNISRAHCIMWYCFQHKSCFIYGAALDDLLKRATFYVIDRRCTAASVGDDVSVSPFLVMSVHLFKLLTVHNHYMTWDALSIMICVRVIHWPPLESARRREIVHDSNVFFVVMKIKLLSKRSSESWRLYDVTLMLAFFHDDVMKWKHFPRYWSFVRGIHQSPVNSPHTKASNAELWCFLGCNWMKGWVNIVTLVIWDAIALIVMTIIFLLHITTVLHW